MPGSRNDWLQPNARAEEETLEYNGVKFGGAEGAFNLHWPQADFLATPQYDDGGRDVVAVNWQIRIKTYLIPTDNPQAGAGMRRKMYHLLNQANKTLKLSRGWGADSVSGGNMDVTRDILLYGCKPQRVSLKTVGNLFGTLHLEWELFAQTHPCEDHIYQSAVGVPFGSFSMGTQWQMDHAGLTTRIRTCTMTAILSNRDRRRWSVDSLRDRIVFSIPLRFRRVSQSYYEAPDKSREMIQVVDKELPGASPPPGMIDADGTVTMVSQGPAFADCSYRLQVSYELLPTHHIGWAVSSFLRTVVSSAALLALTKDHANQPVFETLTVLGVSLQRGLYNSARMLRGEALFHIAGLRNTFFTTIGIYEHFAETNNQNFTDQALPIWRTRGMAGLSDKNTATGGVFDPSIDPCQINDFIFVDGSQNRLPPSFADPHTLMNCENKRKWLVYDVEILQDTESGVEVVKKASAPVSLPRHAVGNSTGDTGHFPLGQVEEQIPTYEEEEAVLEQTMHPETRIGISFVGISMNFPPSVPVLKSVGRKNPQEPGTPLTIEKTEGGYKYIGHSMGCPMYRVRYEQWYKVGQQSTQVKIVKSPISGIPGLGVDDGNI